MSLHFQIKKQPNNNSARTLSHCEDTMSNKLSDKEELIKKLNLEYQDLVRLAAAMMKDLEEQENELNELKKLADDFSKVLTVIKVLGDKDKAKLANPLLDMYVDSDNPLAKALSDSLKLEKSRIARQSSLLKLANDPIQIAKKEIEAHYQNSKNQFKRRGYSAQFIREMHKQYPVITSIKTIESLVAKLNKENELIPR